VKRVIYLAIAALVAMMILVPTAMAQATKMEETMMMEKTMEPLPKSGGPAVSSVLLPAAALLLGSGVLAYAVLRRR
jgi:hydrogenase-4 membrane subunit HyfE